MNWIKLSHELGAIASIKTGFGKLTGAALVSRTYDPTDIISSAPSKSSNVIAGNAAAICSTAVAIVTNLNAMSYVMSLKTNAPDITKSSK